MRGVPEPKKADNGYWYVHWSDGRRSKRQSLGTRDEKQALSRFAQWLLLDGKDRDVVTEKVDYTVEEAWKRYQDKHVQRAGINQKIVDYSWKNLQGYFGPLLVKQVTQDRIDEYEEKRRAGKISTPASAATIRRELAYLVAALNFAAGPKGKLFPQSHIQSFSLPDSSPPRERWLRIEEVEALLRAAAEGRGDDERLTKIERFIWLAVFTGARKTAILNLKWSQVDFEVGVIDYRDPTLRETKKRRAVVPIAAELRPVLEKAREQRKTEYVLDSPHDGIWAALQIVANRAGLGGSKTKKGKCPEGTGISPHTLRHTAGTLMARAGVSLWDVANILGNTMQVTEKVYSKWTPDNPAATVDRIGVKQNSLVSVDSD